MGWFSKETYKRKPNGKWKLVKSEVEHAPTDYGRWKQSGVLEKKKSNGERTYVDFAPTKSGVNVKATQIRTYFSDDEKVVRNLITTSDRLPKKWRDK